MTTIAYIWKKIIMKNRNNDQQIAYFELGEEKFPISVEARQEEVNVVQQVLRLHWLMKLGFYTKPPIDLEWKDSKF